MTRKHLTRQEASHRLALAALVLPALLMTACTTRSPEPSEVVRVTSKRLQRDRQELAGKIATAAGYLVTARMIGDNVCFKLLVDDTLRIAPELLIANGGHAHQTSPRRPDEPNHLLRQLAEADAFATPATVSTGVSQATVIQACKRPPTSANRKAIEHALEWLDALKKPERIENAPNIESLRRELQLFYLERSRRYGWAQLPWDEVVITGVLLRENAELEDEIVGGVDLIPYIVGVHDAQRGRWLVLDLTFNDGVAKELMRGVFGKQIPGLVKRVGKSALSF